MRALKIAGIVIGALMVLVGLGLAASGGFLLWAHNTQRDSDGFYHTSSKTISTRTYALTSPEVDIKVGAEVADWFPKGALGTIQIEATSQPGRQIFVGIGPAASVSAFLANTGHDEIVDIGNWSGSIEYRRVEGGAPPSTPGEQSFWVVSREGSEAQTLEWEIQDGEWTVVIMNVDASSAVSADLRLGARFDVLLPIAIGLLAGGVVVLLVGILLIVLGARPSRPKYQAQAGYPTGGPYPPGTPYEPGHPYQPGEPYQPGQPYQPGEQPRPGESERQNWQGPPA